MVASIEFSTMPIEVVSCSRNESCRSVNGVSAASSITAFTWPSNSTGSTTAFFGCDRKRPERIGTTLRGRLVRIRRRASRAHWPIRPSPSCSSAG